MKVLMVFFGVCFVSDCVCEYKYRKKTADNYTVVCFFEKKTARFRGRAQPPPSCEGNLLYVRILIRSVGSRLFGLPATVRVGLSGNQARISSYSWRNCPASVPMSSPCSMACSNESPK